MNLDTPKQMSMLIEKAKTTNTKLLKAFILLAAFDFCVWYVSFNPLKYMNH